MKTVMWFVVMLLAIWFVSYNNPAFAGETKRVCVDKINPKTKKLTQTCKTTKIHKKLEGTKVPTKKPK